LDCYLCETFEIHMPANNSLCTLALYYSTIFFGRIYFSQIQMTMHTKFWRQHCNVKRPINPTPLWDSNPGSSVLEADSMTTMPRRRQATILLYYMFSFKIKVNDGNQNLYDQYFRRFLQIVCDHIGFFLKNQRYDSFFYRNRCNLSNNRQFFLLFVSAKKFLKL
jgi:hypothetical protein